MWGRSIFVNVCGGWLVDKQETTLIRESYHNHNDVIVIFCILMVMTVQPYTFSIYVQLLAVVLQCSLS
jgi:hypothetical protein